MFMHSVLHSRTSPPRRSAHSTIHRTSPRVSPTPAPSPCSVHTRARRTVYEVQYILLSMGVSQSQWEDVNQQHCLIQEKETNSPSKHPSKHQPHQPRHTLTNALRPVLKTSSLKFADVKEGTEAEAKAQQHSSSSTRNDDVARHSILM